MVSNVITSRQEERVREVLEALPVRIAEEISRISATRRGGIAEIREIRIRAGGRSTVLHGAESLALYTTVTAEETEAVVARLCEGALYAHRDSIASGYISMRGGVRVGLCGYARYEYKSFVGVSDMRSLVFRIPGHACVFGDELYRIYRERVRRGMLIYSPPGVGKTTALRSLAGSIGSGTDPKRVAVIDERCEFCEEDYSACEVDILKGYKRRTGIEIATRTMAPEVIMIDEIGGDDAAAVVGVVRCGIPLIATAHASGIEELFSKVSLAPLFDCDAFDVFVGISRSGGEYALSVDRK